MSSTSAVAVHLGKGVFVVNTVQYDGYLECLGVELERNWKTLRKATILCQGKPIRFLGAGQLERYNEPPNYKTILVKQESKIAEEVFNTFFTEYNYIFYNNKWYYYTIDKRKLLPLAPKVRELIKNGEAILSI